MRIRGNDIQIHAGETFTLNMHVRMPDGSPFIVDKALAHPYVLFTLSSSKELSESKYIRNWWLELTDIVKFSATLPVAIPAFTSNNLALDEGTEDNDGNTITYVYKSTENGVVTYKYWDGEKFVDYDFEINLTFMAEDTINLPAQVYTYSMTFVNGKVNSNPSGEESPPPIVNCDVNIPLIVPSKFTIMSNIKGGLRYDN